MLFRKRPVIVDAIQFTGDNFAEVEAFAGQWAERVKDTYRITTNHGPCTATIGNYIIRSQFGEIYPSSQREFEANYEPIPQSV